MKWNIIDDVVMLKDMRKGEWRDKGNFFRFRNIAGMALGLVFPLIGIGRLTLEWRLMNIAAMASNWLEDRRPDSLVNRLNTVSELINLVQFAVDNPILMDMDGGIKKGWLAAAKVKLEEVKSLEVI